MYTARMSETSMRDGTDQRVADALPGHWVDRHLPSPSAPMRG